MDTKLKVKGQSVLALQSVLVLQSVLALGPCVKIKSVIEAQCLTNSIAF
jgi:hypothetical protein